MTCPSCDRRHSPDDRFCAGCGAALDEFAILGGEAVDGQTTGSGTHGPRRGETLAGLAILVAVIAMIAVLLSGDDGDDAAADPATPTPSAVPAPTVTPTLTPTPAPTATAASGGTPEAATLDVPLPVGSQRVGPPMATIEELAFSSGWLVYDGEQGPTAVNLASGERRVLEIAKAQSTTDQDELVFTTEGVWRINSLRSRLDRWDGRSPTVLANDDFAQPSIQQLPRPDGHRVRIDPDVGPIVYRLLDIGGETGGERLVAHALALHVAREVELAPSIVDSLSSLHDLLTTPTGPSHPTMTVAGRTWEWGWDGGWQAAEHDTVMKFDNGTIARDCDDPSDCSILLVPDDRAETRELDPGPANVVMALTDIAVLEALVGVTNTSLVSFRAPTLAPDGQQMVTLSARDEFVVIDLDSGGRREGRIRRPGPGLYTSMLWSDDSTRVLVVGRDQTSAVDVGTFDVTLVEIDLAQMPRARAQIFASIDVPEN